MTVHDVMIAEDIFGKDVGILKGKTVSKTPNSVNYELVDIPAHIIQHYKEVRVAADLMFINKISFLTIISRYINFCTTEKLDRMLDNHVLKALLQVEKFYNKQGFRLKHLRTDRGFDSLQANLTKVEIGLNTTSNDEHVPEIEQHI